MAAKKKWWVGVLLKGKWKNHQVFQLSGDPGPKNWPDCDYVVGPFDKREDARKWAHVLRSARAAALREVMHMEPKRKQPPSGNPARILLDAVRRAGWAEDEIDISSFTAAADYCDEEVQADRQADAIASAIIEALQEARKRDAETAPDESEEQG